MVVRKEGLAAKKISDPFSQVRDCDFGRGGSSGGARAVKSCQWHDLSENVERFARDMEPDLNRRPSGYEQLRPSVQ